ncbi:M1 family aminopeptidase [Chitinophaga sp. Ak27]|uniref:M1 family aminopeptidase n=1 Tax=Chitinophaga sp. Ak27 TaxID=2726116 RepID=UPI00145D5215|nr:M1 family aminopeptidase [Chitinophaga sp. Ak27]NLU91436.1 M1 family metallopeptidase [Chitinophaga sp. Ak27]
MRRLTLLLFLLCPLWLCAQRQLIYQLQVQADPEKKAFQVTGSLRFTTSTPATDTVTMVMSRGQGHSRLQLEGRSAAMDTSTNESGDIVYHWRFSRPLPEGTVLRFSYVLDRGATPAFQFYIDSSFCMAGGYGSAWYPQVMARAADGTDNAIRGGGSIRVTTPAGFMPVMAASKMSTAIPTGSGQTTEFRYDQPDIFSLYIGHYTRQEYQGKYPFYTYSISKSVNGSQLSRQAAMVLDYLASLFGPLTIPNFSIIEFPDAVSERTGIGGASVLGGVVMPTGALHEFNYALFGHEIGHQWWGNKVLSKGRRGAEMLSEGMAQYGSLQVVSHFDSAHAIYYRKTGYAGYLRDQSGLGYLKNVAAGNDEPLSALTGGNGHTLGDSKGFLALELLSNVVGKSVFHKAMQTISNQYSRDGVSWDQFLHEMETAHGSSLQWFYRQWFERTGAPAWEQQWQQQGNHLQLTITQKDSLYQLPLEVLVTYKDGHQVMENINIDSRSETFQLPVTNAVASVQVDPYFKVLHWEDSLARIAYAQARPGRVLWLRMDGKDNEAASLAHSYLKEGIAGDTAGVEFSLLYQLGRITSTQNKPAEALGYYQRALQCASRVPELLAYTYFRIAQIAAGQHNTELMQWAGRNAITADEANQKADGMAAKVALLEN